MTSKEVPELMTPSEVAALWNVDPKTVHRWDKTGRFPPGTVTRTLGGHRRFKADKIRALFDERQPQDGQS